MGKGNTRRKYVSEGKGAVDVLPTRIQMESTNVLIVHDKGSMRQQHLIQFPMFTILAIQISA